MIFYKHKTPAAAQPPVQKSAGRPLTLLDAEGWPEQYLAGNLEDASMRISTVNACVEIISNSVAVLPPYIMSEVTKQHIDDHYLGQVLWERPNEMMTRFDFEKVGTALQLLRGNNYVWLYRDGAGRTVEQIPIPPGCCTPYFDPGGGRWWYIATDPKTGQSWRMSPADIIHYKAFSHDGIHGISVVQRARETLEAAGMATRYETAMYANGGRPAGVLTTESDITSVNGIEVTGADGEPTTITAKDAIRAEWEKIHGGAGNAFRVAILDLGLKYQPIAMSNLDAQFIENRALAIEDICRFFVVPPYKVGVGKQAYNSNEQNNIEFAMQTLQPLVTGHEQEDTGKLLTLTERRKTRLRVRRNMAAILRADAKTRAEVENVYRMNGTYSVNDICDLEDRPHVPGGDTRYGSLNYVPLEFFERLSIARNEKPAGGGNGDGA